MAKSYFPPKSLKEASVIAKTIYEKNSGQPMLRLTIAEEVDLAPEGRAFRDLVTASAGYGLTSGSYISERLALADLGPRVVCNDIDAVYESLFLVDLFKRFYEHFKGGASTVPAEKAARDYLSECGVPEKFATAIYQGIIQNGKDWGLIRELGGSDRFLPIDEAKKWCTGQTQVAGAGQVRPTSDQVVSQPITRPVGAFTVMPGLHLDIQIHIGADTPDDKIEAVFRNMKTYLLTNE